MLMEITGAGFDNKGAELMLRETVRRIRGNMPEAIVAIPAASGTYEQKAELGLWHLIRYCRFGVEWGALAALAPADYRHRMGIVVNAELDVILDVSGYRYGGLFGPRSVEYLALRARKARRNGKKLILLPQAFGPFIPASKDHLKAVVENTNLIYPRDEASYRYIVDLVGERDNVRMAPDFTAPLPGFLRPEHERLRGRFCMIPNRRMLDKTVPEVRNAYVPLMRRCVTRASGANAKPYVLIHETGDVALAHEIVDGLNPEIDIVIESDACAIKGIIGVASAVVCSRFHGLVNALCQGIPALGTGWSHKYEMLFRDYGFDDGIVRIPCDDDEIDVRMTHLLDPVLREHLVTKLRKASDGLRQANESMWDEVFGVLNAG